MIPKKDIQKAINKIIKCSLGKWYVGRTDGKTDEVVLLDDVLAILMTLINEKENKASNKFSSVEYYDVDWEEQGENT